MMGLFSRKPDIRYDLAFGDGTLLIRPPQLVDCQQWLSVRSASHSFLQPWEPTWPSGDLTSAAFRRRILRYSREMERDEAYPFLILRVSDGALLGGINFTNVRRGAASMASLGYWMAKAHAGQGHLTLALGIMIPIAFASLKIRRIEAACLPDNKASIRVLEKAGFMQEGYARDYLAIDGAWRDHLLFAKIREDASGVKGINLRA
jgi:[ribosomal protein S5]-alanine N-acetyltransferase